jgi:hypothetical protein
MDIVQNDPSRLLVDPRVIDSLTTEHTRKKEVRDSRPVETGDILITKINSIWGSEINLDVITFRPSETPEEYLPGLAHYPATNKDVYINGHNIFSRIEGVNNTTSHHTALPLTESNHPPVKSLYLEIVEKNNPTPEITDRKLFDPQNDMPQLDLEKSELKALEANAVEVRRFIAENMLDQLENDARLHQLDNLINYLSSQLLFIHKA